MGCHVPTSLFPQILISLSFSEPQMFPSNYSGCSPFTYTDQAMFDRHFTSDGNPNSKQEPPSSSFFHFSPPFIYEDGILPHHQDQELLMDHPLPQQQQQHLVMTNSTEANVWDRNSGGGSSNFNSGEKTYNSSVSTKKVMPRKRSVKKDRHSKINTAQGPRDRRIRLSLDSARKFFDLQDTLNFDKASKTVEWLLNKSKAAIKELKSLSQIKHNCTDGTKSVSSTMSECEVESIVDETGSNGGDGPGTDSKGKSALMVDLAVKEKKMKQSRRPLPRESRAKARARARERTRKKIWSRSSTLDESKQCFEATTTNHQLWSSSPLVETGEESGSLSYNMNSSLQVVADQVEEPSSHSLDIAEDSFVITSKPNPCLIFNYHHNIPFSIQESEFGELQLYAKPWEAYNNQSLW